MVDMIENMQAPEIGAELEKITEFVKRNTVPADNSKVECSDGRYTPEQSNGAIRVFGADFGILASIVKAAKDKGAGMTEEGILSRYQVALEHRENERDGTLHFHTDGHSKEHGEVGCGHIKRLIKEEGMEELFGKLTAYKNKETVLMGKHEEKGVLLVYSNEKSVNSFDPETEEMYFVVDMQRIKEYIEKITPKLSIPHISPEDVWNSYQNQMLATASILAPNQKMFRVSFEGEEPEIRFEGTISPLA